MTLKLKAIIKIALNTILLPGIILTVMSCKECPSEPEPEPEPEPEYNIHLSTEDVLCTRVTFNITLPDSGIISFFELNRNGCPIDTYSCVSVDTFIIDENLVPDSDYHYKVRFLKNGEIEAESDSVKIHTLPSTSHDIVWEIDTLGNYDSYLKDVWIVDENNIWVVGNIETDSGEYNAAHWNGSEWELLGIYSNTADVYSICYFFINDIWVTSHCLPLHWDGNKWTLYNIQNMGLDACAGYAIWASSPDDIYFIGYRGSIVHYNGSDFTKMDIPTEDGTTEADLLDIWGSDENHIWACGYDDQTPANLLLTYQSGEWTQVYDASRYRFEYQRDSLCAQVLSIWSSSSFVYVLTGFGVHRCRFQTNGEAERLWLNQTGLAQRKIRGNGDNDLFMIGQCADIWHFNGIEWHYYNEIVNDLDRLKSVCVRDDIIVAVGERRYNGIQRLGLVMIGYR